MEPLVPDLGPSWGTYQGRAQPRETGAEEQQGPGPKAEELEAWRVCVHHRRIKWQHVNRIKQNRY